MVVYKMENGELWCHSGVALKKETLEKMESFGKVGVIIVPNGQHTIDAPVYQQRYPEAKLICPSSHKPL